MIEAVVAVVCLVVGGGIGMFLAARAEGAKIAGATADVHGRLALAQQEAAAHLRAHDTIRAESAAVQARLEDALPYRTRCEEHERAITDLRDRLAVHDRDLASLRAEVTDEKAAHAQARAALEGATRALDLARADHERALDDHARTAREHAERRLADKDAELAKRDAFIQQLEERMRETLGKAANEAVQKAQEDFLKISGERANDDLEKRQRGISELVTPLQTELKELKALSERIQQERAGQVETVKEQVERLQDQTVTLANALRKPQTRGAWGEQQLEVLLENAGLIEGQDFTVQESTTEDEGRLRADFVITLPHGRKLVIDCKTPFDAYMDAMNAGDETAHAAGMKRHVDAVRGHIRELSSKAYWSRHPGADCVIMFIPHEGAYIHALQTDPGLIDLGRDQKVYLASPNSILGIVHMARYILAEKKARDGADKLREECNRLVERVAVIAERLSATGRSLSSAVKNYNEVVGSLDGRLMPTVRELQKQGVGSGKALVTPDAVGDGTRGITSPELQDGALALPLGLEEDPSPLLS